jgi:hypothetical protein
MERRGAFKGWVSYLKIIDFLELYSNNKLASSSLYLSNKSNKALSEDEFSEEIKQDKEEAKVFNALRGAIASPLRITYLILIKELIKDK